MLSRHELKSWWVENPKPSVCSEGPSESCTHLLPSSGKVGVSRACVQWELSAPYNSPDQTRSLRAKNNPRRCVIGRSTFAERQRSNLELSSFFFFFPKLKRRSSDNETLWCFAASGCVCVRVSMNFQSERALDVGQLKIQIS